MTLHNPHLHPRSRKGSQRAFALLLVVLILMGMLIIGVPFAVSMRLSSNRSRTTLANAHARFAAEGAYNHAIACLMRTQEQHDVWPRTDSSFYESHALDIPAELRVTFEPDPGDELDIEYMQELDLTGELETRNPRGLIWSVEIEDEQGKINLNSASHSLLKNILYLLGPDTDGDPQETTAGNAATALTSYRRENGGFNTISEAESVIRDTGHFDSGQLVNLSRYVTVSSERPSSRAMHPINVNSAPQLVLVANMMNLRLRELAAVKVGGDGSKSNGWLSPIEVTSDTHEHEGDWKLAFVEAGIGQLFFRQKDSPNWVEQQQIVLVIDPRTQRLAEKGYADNGIRFTIYPGTEDFQNGDTFYFSTRRISRELAESLAEAMQATVEMKAGDKGGEVQQFEFEDPEANYYVLGEQGHAAIGADLMYYVGEKAESQFGPPSPRYAYGPNYAFQNMYSTDVTDGEDYENNKAYELRRIIACPKDLQALDDRILYHLIHKTEYDSDTTKKDTIKEVPLDIKVLADSLHSALKLNAMSSSPPDIDGATAPFCFTTSDSYTVAARASVNDKAGNETASRGLKRIVSIKRTTPITDEGGDKQSGEWCIDTEMAFNLGLSGSFRVTKGINDLVLGRRPNTIALPLNENKAGALLPAVSLASRRVSDIAFTFGGDHPIDLHFGGDLSFLSALLGGTVSPLSGIVYKEGASERMQSTSCFGAGEEGITFKEEGADSFTFDKKWPRIAYSTQHASIPGLGSTCKSIEMWFRPEQTKAEENSGDPPWSDDERDYFLFDTSLPYCGLDDGDYSQETLAKLCHQNRIALFYSGSTDNLVFRISDASMSAQSAEVRYHFDPGDQPGWHHIKAIWSGMGFGEMVLLIDGEAPDGEDPDDGGTGRYHPKIEWQNVGGANGPVIVGNQIYEAPDNTTPSRGTPGDLSLRDGEDPVQPYGYSASFQNISTGSDADDTAAGVVFNDLSAYGRTGPNPTDRATLASDFDELRREHVFIPHGLNPGDMPDDVIVVEGTKDFDNFQDKGFLKIKADETNFEFAYFDSKGDYKLALPGGDTLKVKAFKGVLRGIYICPDGFGTGDHPCITGVQEPKLELQKGFEIEQISLHVDDNRHYPTPLYFATEGSDIPDLGTTAGYFGISNKPKNYVRIGDEFISYTHKPGTNFLVDVTANTVADMRGQLGSTESDHDLGAAVYPVYRFGHGSPGGPAEADEGSAVTVIDNDLEPFEMVIHTIEGGNIAFTDFFPPGSHCRLTRMEDGESVSKAPRFLKFPSGEFNAGEFFGIGTNSGPKADYDDDATNPFRMDMPAEATIDEFKVSLGDDNIRVPRVTGDPVPSWGLSPILILFPNRWDEDFDLSSGGSAVKSWPTQGYAQIGDEIIYYRTLNRYNETEYESGAGAICAPSSNVYITGVVNPADRSITWSWPANYQLGIDPGSAGFCEEGGYLTIRSRTPYTWQPPGADIVLTDAAVQHLIAAGLLTEEQLENGILLGGMWTFAGGGGGLTGGGTKKEVIRYGSLVQNDDEWQITGIDRGLFGTTAEQHAPVQKLDEDGQPAEDNDGNPEWHYPQLIANTVELQIVQRGCLGTQAKRHHIGSKLMPLYHIVSTFMTGPLAATDNKLYVESNANFPHRGYLLVSDGTKQEIIGYTSKGYDEEVDADGETVRKPYFGGVRYLRRRFGTPLVRLDDLSIIDLSSADLPPDVNCRKGVVRLYEPRYDDRLPTDPGGVFVWHTGNVNIEGNPAYLEITRTIRGARWESITWAEGPNATWDNPASNPSNGTRIFILARVDGEPDWNEEPVDPDDGPAILRFDAPTDDTTENNRIDIDGDTLELRIYFAYNDHYADQNTGKIEQWLSPLLRGLKIGYSAPSSVYQQEEVRF